jgi:hypothetical protein
MCVLFDVTVQQPLQCMLSLYGGRNCIYCIRVNIIIIKLPN